MSEPFDRLQATALQAYWAYTPDMAFLKDTAGVYQRASQTFAKQTGHADAAAVVGKTDAEVFGDATLARRYRADDERLLRLGVPMENYIEPFDTRDGRARYCLTSKYILRDENGEALGIYGISRDITQEYLARQNYENALRCFLQPQPDMRVAVLIDVTSWRVVDARRRQPGRGVFFDYVTVDDYLRAAEASVVNDETVRARLRGLTQPYLEAQFESGVRDLSFEYLHRASDGSQAWVCAELRLLLDPVNGNLSMVALLRDIDESRRAYAERQLLDERDPVTGLLTRKAMVAQMEAFLQSEAPSLGHALFLLDLDDFKRINDAFGHPYGDGILRKAGEAVRAAFSNADLVAHMGGDGFMALMKDVDSAEIACRRAQALVSAVQFSMRGDQATLSLTPSVGLTLFRCGERDFATLYSEADSALYRAKANGKNQYFLFGSDLPDDRPEAVRAARVDTVHLGTLLENLDGGVLMAEVTDDIRVTYVSPSMFRTMGRTEAEIGADGSGVFGVVLPEDLPGLKTALHRVAEGDELLDSSYRVTSADGVRWRHIRAKRIPDGENGARRLVAVVTDITFLKRTEEHLREMETRYRTAVEQTDTMLWEVDVPARVLTLQGRAWSLLEMRADAYPDMPEGFLRQGLIHRDSAADFRRMFADMARGDDSGSYILKTCGARGGVSWVRVHFRLLRNEAGAPTRALGVTQRVPNINADMVRFEQEIQFANLVRGSLLSYACANLTQNRLERLLSPGGGRRELEGASYDDCFEIVCDRYVVPEDEVEIRRHASREALLASFRKSDGWRFANYRRVGQGGAARWSLLFVKLMRHPVTGDIYAFLYLKDNHACRLWELALGMPPRQDAGLLLYSREAMAELGRHALAKAPGGSVAAATVFALTGMEHYREAASAADAGELLFAFGRLCRLLIAGDALIGRLDESRVVLLRVDAGSAERQRERVSHTLALLKRQLALAHPEANVSLTGGYAVDAAAHTSYDLLLHKAEVACRSAVQTMGESVVAYADTGVEPDAPDGDWAARYRALEQRYQQQAHLLRVSENDSLTGLPGKDAFYRRVREVLQGAPGTRHAIVRLDINRFKVYNDVCGTAAGDRLLHELADALRKRRGGSTLCARLGSDHFALLTPDDPAAIRRSMERLVGWLAESSPGFKLSCSVGVYPISDPTVDVSLMCDRALLALRAAKTGFETRLSYYDEALRDRLLDEQRLMDDMEAALRERQFEVYFQPQVNYESGSWIGAEALVRWNHPARGLLSPAAFIPLFEKNGLITRLDEYVWDSACRHIRDWSARVPAAAELPISVNVSRLDIYDPHLCQTLLDTVARYGLPVSALKLEITESAYVENPQQLIATVNALQQAGFLVEMDDFGSGYSSLNTLKDVAVDVLKLDMKFLANCADSARGGNILSSIIRMAHWLKLPIIAEGVETQTQADYLKSLSCVYMQGYYFARPLPAEAFIAQLSDNRAARADRYHHVDLEGVAAFWDASAQTALLFNSFVGGAAILEREGDTVSTVRANDRFFVELGTTREAYQCELQNTQALFDAKNAALFADMLSRAAGAGDEAECELRALPAAEGGKPAWLHCRVRPLAQNGGTWLFYLAVENISARKELEAERDAENERSRLLMQATGTSFVDYDYGADTLLFQLYRAESGVTQESVPNCLSSFIAGPYFDANAAAQLRALLQSPPPGENGGELEFRADLWGKGMRWYRLRYAILRDDAGRPSRLVGQSDNIQAVKEREALAEALGRRLHARPNERAFSDVIVNQIFSLFYDSSDIVGAIETTLALLGEHFGLSRVYVCEDRENHDANANTFAWLAPGVPAFRQFPYTEVGGLARYADLFGDSGTFFCPDVNALEPEVADRFASQGVRSLLQCAIKDGGAFAGLVGFDECSESHAWTDEQIGTLVFVSRIIGAFLIKLRRADSAAFSADFRAALDDNAAYQYIIDPDTFEIIYNNKAIHDVYGTDYIGKTCYREFIGRDTPCPQCPVLRLREADAPRIAEVRRPDGMLLLTQASPLRWNGRDMAMLSCLDITESRKAEQALITEKRKTDLAVAAANLTLWTYDIVADSLSVTRSIAPEYHDGEEVPGGYRAILRSGLVLPESEEDYVRLHERVRIGERTASAVIHFDSARCDSEWLRITYTTLFDENGRAASAIGVGLDVSAQKEAEARYRQEAAYRQTLGDRYLLTARINVTTDVVESVQTAQSLNAPFAVGMRRDELVPRFADRVVDADDRAQFEEFFTADNLRYAFERGKTELEFPLRVASAGGRRRFLHVGIKLTERPEDGALVAFIAIGDQTSSELFKRVMQKLIDASYDYIAYIDADTKHFQLFASGAELRAALPSAGDDYDASMAEGIAVTACEADREALTRRSSLSAVTDRLSRADEYLLTYRSTPETGSRTRQLAFRAISPDRRQLMLTRQDVTALVEEARLGNERLERALGEARAANAAKSAFLSRMSHDIRTPLNAIIGLTALTLEHDDLPDEAADALRKIDSSGQFLQRLLGDILDMSKIEQGLLLLRPERYEYDDFLGTLRAIFEPLCYLKGVRFEMAEGRLRPPLLADGMRLEQIFCNVLSNAVRFTPAGGTVRYEERNEIVENGYLSCDFVIRDTGCGMDPAFLPRAFELFAQERDNEPGDASGSGLGLPIARSLVELMGGKIELDSAPDKGTEVRIHLRLRLAPDGPVATDAPALPPPRGARVLLAEDVPLNAAIVRGLLEREEIAVEIVPDGQAAVERFSQAAEGTYDAILMDIAMPVMDGLEAARRIRALSRADAQAVPIIALSANAFQQDQEQSREAGINAHLAKPLKPRLLMDTLARQIAERRAKA